MSKPVPQIRKYMTTTPITMGAEQTLATASAKMTEHRVRHLPVLKGGKLVGIISDRDVRLAESFQGVDPKVEPLDFVMTNDVYTVGPETPLDEVVGHMAETKVGSAIVVDAGHVVGVFTTTDACRALAELLETRLRK
ncbi:MAG: CBS domain-containing protein [Myxococcota bacterium]|nr:CBS domain-containing protein [Myxococcota bacterium]